MINSNSVEISLYETLGIERINEPVTMGIPFPKGRLISKNNLSLFDIGNNSVPIQAEILAKWPDESIKWILLDFMADCRPNAIANYTLKLAGSRYESISNNAIKIIETESVLKIDTGKAIFVMDKTTFYPFKSVMVSASEMIISQDSRVLLVDENQQVFFPAIKQMSIETNGALRSTIKVHGKFESGKDIFSDFYARVSFYAGLSLSKIEFTIRNPKAAKHPGGLWDLGDEGSVYFKDLSFNFALREEKDVYIFWKSGNDESKRLLQGNRIEIYQDSSGGENWDCPNHINRSGKVPNSFRGYRVTADSLLQEGHRATPSLTVSSGNKSITGVIRKFWQNFPKSIEVHGNVFKLRLFPQQNKDVFELQGGEQKTHSIYVQFGLNKEESMNLDWIQEPLIAKTTPEWHAKCRALGYMSPSRYDKNRDYQKLIDNVIYGKSNFFDLRETIDEYGWRNFGEVYANHEIVSYKGSLLPFVSHYNNQYDIIHGCILQFARTGEVKWYQLMTDLASHVIDIDIYHTEQDRPTFNGGQFWHTDHFMHAETSTHRSFSVKNGERNGLKSYGGGLSAEHCYTTGLLNYYYLTGDVIAKEAVLEIADWIMNMDTLEKNLFGVLRKVRRLVNSMRNVYANAPGRAQGNALNTLMDAFQLTGKRNYIMKAESLIRKYISSSDDIDKLNMQQIELRWFYLIFLQGLGKYLDIKHEMSERDEMYDYSKESLLHHAQWMLANEVPFSQKFNIVEIISSTWPAHDIRKSAIFDYAWKYSEGNLRERFREKAEYFYNRSIEDVMSFNDGSKTFVRPLAILMHYGVMHTYFQNMSDDNNE